jgi:hypothetical protein
MSSGDYDQSSDPLGFMMEPYYPYFLLTFMSGFIAWIIKESIWSIIFAVISLTLLIVSIARFAQVVTKEDEQ